MSALSDLFASARRSLRAAAAGRREKRSVQGERDARRGRLRDRRRRRRRGGADIHPADERDPRSAPARPAGAGDIPFSPGQHGPDATVEVDPHTIGPVRMTYRPDPDQDPDPGEIAWTWVPYEENDGRGKDRPVLIVAAEEQTGQPRTWLAVQLTSVDHSGDRDFVAVGAGGWDHENRPSWVNIDRVMRLHRGGMRREATALSYDKYRHVEAALRQRYGWSLA